MAVHEVDRRVAREVRPFARVHEVPPLAGGVQPGRHDVVAVAALERKRTQQKPPNRRRIYRVGLSSHTVFSSQAISVSRSATTS